MFNTRADKSTGPTAEHIFDYTFPVGKMPVCITLNTVPDTKDSNGDGVVTVDGSGWFQILDINGNPLNPSQEVYAHYFEEVPN